jgi:hypothetical protein
MVANFSCAAQKRRNVGRFPLPASGPIRIVRYTWAVPDCPVCRRSFDARFSVFVPPHAEPFDTVECARSAANTASTGVGSGTPPGAPLILPTIEVLTSLRGQAKAVGARAPVAAGLRERAPVPLAVAAGLTLVVVGSASSLYLWSGLPQSGLHATRTTAPLTAPPAAASDGGPIAPAPLDTSTGNNAERPAGVEPVALVSSESAASSEAGASSSVVETPAASSPSEPPPPPPAPAEPSPEPSSKQPPPTAPTSAPPSRPQPSPQAPATPSSPPGEQQPSPQPPPAGGKNPDGGPRLPSTPGTAGSVPTQDDSPGAKPPKKPKPPKPPKPKKPKTPKKPPAPSPPTTPAADPAAPATPTTQPPAYSEDDGDQVAASGSQGTGYEAPGRGNGNGKGNGKKP